MQDTHAGLDWASAVAHEAAHHTDLIEHQRRGAHGPWGWLNEPLAVAAEEQVMRTGRSGAVRPQELADATLARKFLDPFWARMPGRELTPWKAWNYGNYTYAAQIIVYARQLHRDEAAETRATLYQKLDLLRIRSTSARDVLGRVAAAMGVPVDTLAQHAMIASATQSLIGRAAARAAGLPQFDAWDLSGWARPRAWSRQQSQQQELTAAPGAYAAAYLFAEEARGVSLQALSFGDAPVVVRLIRLR